MQAGALHRGGGEEQGRLQGALRGGGEEMQAGALRRGGREEQGFKEEEERKFYHVF